MNDFPSIQTALRPTFTIVTYLAIVFNATIIHILFNGVYLNNTYNCLVPFGFCCLVSEFITAVEDSWSVWLCVPLLQLFLLGKTKLLNNIALCIPFYWPQR